MTFSILFNELNKSEGSSLVAVSNQRLLLVVASLAAEQTLGTQAAAAGSVWA